MNWVGFAGAAGALIALVIAMVRIVGLTKEKGELKLDKAALEVRLAMAEQATADGLDRIGKLTLVCDNRQRIINELFKTLQKSGKPGAAGAALDELLSGKAPSPPDPQAPGKVPAQPTPGKPTDPAGSR